MYGSRGVISASLEDVLLDGSGDQFGLPLGRVSEQPALPLVLIKAQLATAHFRLRLQYSLHSIVNSWRSFVCFRLRSTNKSPSVAGAKCNSPKQSRLLK